MGVSGASRDDRAAQERRRAGKALPAAFAAVATAAVFAVLFSCSSAPNGLPVLDVTPVERPADLRAYFNGEEATVLDAVVSVGQPCALELAVRANAHLEYVVLCVYEPGADQVYSLLEGQLSSAVYDVPEGTELRFRWVVAPNGDWTGGRAPIQLFYSIRTAGTTNFAGGDAAIRGTFAFANPYIEG